MVVSPLNLERLSVLLLDLVKNNVTEIGERFLANLHGKLWGEGGGISSKRSGDSNLASSLEKNLNKRKNIPGDLLTKEAKTGAES